MNQSNELTLRFREVMLSGQWVTGTNVKAQIDPLNLEEATAKFADLNTLAALTFHLHYYVAGVLQVMEGGTLDIRDQYSFDMPALKTTAEWNSLKEKLWADAEKFAVHVSNMTDEQLQSNFVMEKYGTWQRNIDVMIEHCYYHLGQIVLIRKLLKPAVD